MALLPLESNPEVISFKITNKPLIKTIKMLLGYE